MSGGHFGIDPRKKKNIMRDIRPSSAASLRSLSAKSPTRPSTALSRPAYNFSSSQRAQTRPSTPLLKEIMPSNVHQQFDTIIMQTKNMSLNEAVESGMASIFDAEICYLWFVDVKTNTNNNTNNNGNNSNSKSTSNTKHKFYSPTKNQICEENMSILSEVYMKNEMMNLTKPSINPHFYKFIDSDILPSLYIPISTPGSDVIAIIQIIREISRKFTPFDLKIACSLQEKFINYSHFLFRVDAFDIFANEIATSKTQNIISTIIEQVEKLFECRTVEFWINDEENSYAKYDTAVNTYVAIGGDSPGVVIKGFKSCSCPLSFEDCTKVDAYNKLTDGEISENVLVVPYKLGELPSVVCIRGTKKHARFTFYDIITITHLIPLIVKCIITESGSDPSNDLSSRLKALLEVAEILSGVLDIDVLLPTIMTRACSLLHTERCSLFILDAKKKALSTRVQSKLDKSITIPIDKGIAGHTATTGAIVNIEDAYSDSRFDQSVDKATGFTTKTILSVPIFNNRSEIVGVTEMINREDGKTFDDEDIKMLTVFNVFCGISLDNAIMYQASINLTRQLQGFVEMSTALNNNSKSIRSILEEIALSAKDAINGTRVTLFMKNEDSNTLFNYISIGDPVTHGTKFSSSTMQGKKCKMFTPGEIALMNNTTPPATDPHHGESIKIDTSSSLSRITSMLHVSDSGDIAGISLLPTIGELPESICCFPLLKSDQSLIGVLEIACRRRLLPGDIKLLDCFSMFASVSLEKSELQSIATLGRAEVELKKFINPNEKSQIGVIPTKLKIASAQTLYKIEFDAPQWDGIGYFRVIWAIFDTFKLFREYKITNETFFKFLDAISNTYNKVPYHNWRHAVDVTQFVTYQIKTAKLDLKLPKFEMFALIVAAICHDANHDGFTNAFNVKAETPLGILFKNQSVMETHHCSVAIEVISKEECNIFESLDQEKNKEIWNLIIQLILTTDMARHHEFLNEVNALLDKEPIDYKIPEHRFIVMQLLLKCADISNVSRPYELADKWCDVLCEEFFRQGDLEVTSGMEYTSPLNDRAHLDKPKSQIGFYTFVCLPLFQCAARAIPPLKVNVDQVMSNLATWKEKKSE